jgi:MFS family permease
VRDKIGTEERVCDGGYAHRNYRHRPTSQVNRTKLKKSNDDVSARLSGKTRLFLAGNFLSMLGTGLVLPFMIIYLHQARRIALPVVGGMLAAGAAIGLVAVIVCGALLDRVGARLVLGMILLGQVVAEVGLAWAHDTPTAWPVVLIYGATWTPMFGAISTMLNGLTREPALQQRAFAVNFATQNMALGIGAAVAALVVRAHHPGTFQVLFLANGLSCLLFAFLMPALPNLRRTRVVNEVPLGYRYVLSHRGLRLMIGASLLLAFIGPASFDSGVPAFASVAAHISFHAIALSFTINTGVIVAVQMLMLRLVSRHRRSAALAAVGLIFVVCWVLLGFIEVIDDPSWRIVILFIFVALFGVGETIVAPTRNPLINSLADDRIRGRANSIAGFAASLMLIISPAIVTSLLAAHLGAVWIALLCLASLGLVAIAARLRVILTAEQDHVKPPPVAEAHLQVPRLREPAPVRQRYGHTHDTT